MVGGWTTHYNITGKVSNALAIRHRLENVAITEPAHVHVVQIASFVTLEMPTGIRLSALVVVPSYLGICACWRKRLLNGCPFT